jgi:transposase InsO family protein
MTDNGSCYRSKAFRDACRDLGLRHIRTRPYTPRTNGKAERFIQTALREWAYAQAYPTPHISAPPSCQSGCTDTTGIVRTAA